MFSNKTRQIAFKNAARRIGSVDHRWRNHWCRCGSPVSSIGIKTGLIEMQDFAEGTSSLDQTCSWRYSLSEDI